MRVSIRPSEQERDDADSEARFNEAQLEDIWQQLRDASAADVRAFIQSKLRPYPPSEAQWILLLKLVGFLLIAMRAVIKRVFRQ